MNLNLNLNDFEYLYLPSWITLWDIVLILISTLIEYLCLMYIIIQCCYYFHLCPHSMVESIAMTRARGRFIFIFRKANIGVGGTVFNELWDAFKHRQFAGIYR